MTEAGKIIAAENGRVTVRFSRKASCDRCNMCMMGKNDMHIDYTFDCGESVRVGDIALTELSSALFSAAVLLAYIMPIILMTAAFLVSRALSAPEWAQAVAALAAAAAAFAAAGFIDKKWLRRTRMTARIVKIIGADNGQCSTLNAQCAMADEK
jgi:positive regulator of sigma E activity